MKNDGSVWHFVLAVWFRVINQLIKQSPDNPLWVSDLRINDLSSSLVGVKHSDSYVDEELCFVECVGMR